MDEVRVLDQAHGDGWAFWCGDCVDVLRGLPESSVDLCVYSPPFSSVYTYSASERDMGNVSDDGDFCERYAFVAERLLSLVRPGRLCAVHCKDLVDYRGSAGRAGLRDFPGALVRVHEDVGWKYHARCTIWKSPVVEMQRTKAHGLLYKQLRADGTFSRMGLAEYVLFFRRWPADEAEAAAVVPVTHTTDDIPLPLWQEWASPVWMTIDQTNVLNVAEARQDADEKHMCPLQLDVVERIVRLYSNPGETVLSPFGGIASEGVVSLRHGRRFVGVELKPEYWRLGVENLRHATAQMELAL